MKPPNTRVEDCSGCGEEMYFDEDYRTDTDDPLYCVPCLRDKVRGRCILARLAYSVGDFFLEARCYEDAWVWVKHILEVTSSGAACTRHDVAVVEGEATRGRETTGREAHIPTRCGSIPPTNERGTGAQPASPSGPQKFSGNTITDLAAMVEEVSAAGRTADSEAR